MFVPQLILMNRLDFKTILLGKQGSGKTSLVKTFTTKRFPHPLTYDGGIGADFDCVHIAVSPNRNATLQIWDTRGQERFINMERAFYRGSDIVLVCFDSCSQESFSDVEKWIEETKKQSNKERVLIYIVATKIDKRQRKITTKQGETLAKSLNVPYKEVSCKNYDSVKDLFTDVTIAAYQQFEQQKNAAKLPKAKKATNFFVYLPIMIVVLAFALWYIYSPYDINKLILT